MGTRGRLGGVSQLVRRFLKPALAAFLCVSSMSLMGDTAPFTLTPEHLVASIAIPAEVMAAAWPVLEVDVTELSNPGMVPIGVAVSMVSGDRKIPMGNFAFFPSDNKGNFMIDSRSAFAQVGRSGTAHLVFELEKLRPSAAWQPLRVTIAPPRWRAQ
jgi:hypothetical protein